MKNVDLAGYCTEPFQMVGFESINIFYPGKMSNSVSNNYYVKIGLGNVIKIKLNFKTPRILESFNSFLDHNKNRLHFEYYKNSQRYFLHFYKKKIPLGIRLQIVMS